MEFMAAAALDCEEAPAVTCPYDVTIGIADWVGKASQSLHENGFVALHPSASGTVITKGVCTDCTDSALELLRKVQKRLADLQIQPGSCRVAFNEVCTRHSGHRFDLALDSDPWKKLQQQLEAVCLPVFKNAGFETAAAHRKGCVVSLPGAPAQSFHVDGTRVGMFNVFVPLVEVGELNGTELEPASHSPQCFAFTELPGPPPCTPKLAAGSVMIMDYRTRHRGLANQTPEIRPLGYAVFSTHGQLDTNFPTDRPLLAQ